MSSSHRESNPATVALSERRQKRSHAMMSALLGQVSGSHAGSVADVPHAVVHQPTHHALMPGLCRHVQRNAALCVPRLSGGTPTQQHLRRRRLCLRIRASAA
eukprot:CAMPEP_0204168762 /NCGR_PEP_ID=MMETSP0361-20130328/40997_1 /ASSEMBLY_ACC=CAM_ASM_000343 /TAXON_ID=268821 /ORGANISM="Scrippsiella Hangoei, Strain SHTV-5" /LENGTH=101 /DNA_ID=CAMNT_0051126253 /DNA_START=414 /DNA_END=716 /DNA_ORIENTATION=+